MEFYKCSHCGNIITKLTDKGVPVMCCGEKMQLLVADEVDAAVEKHVPTVEKDNNTLLVNVGSTIHPMEEGHYIDWICVETKDNFYFKKLSIKPEAKFLVDEEVINVYSYCNLHGLWKN